MAKTRPRSNKPSAAVVASVVGAWLLGVAVLGGVVLHYTWKSDDLSNARYFAYRDQENRRGEIVLWWDGVPKANKAQAQSARTSNIHPKSYAGSDACQQCHVKQHADWFGHSHRTIVAKATTAAVLGDFSGDATIEYWGGVATFLEHDGKFLMRLERDGAAITFEVTQAIGTRQMQYYAGRQFQGPNPFGHQLLQQDHVLPFGYWIEQNEWIPIEHVSDANPSPDDPYRKSDDPFQMGDEYAFPAYRTCAVCHDTVPLSELLTQHAQQLVRHVPQTLHWHFGRFMEKEHEQFFPAERKKLQGMTDEQINTILKQKEGSDFRQAAVSEGVGCEACHLGCKAHAEKPTTLPEFTPRDPLLYLQKSEATGTIVKPEKFRDWMCANCHSSDRFTYANHSTLWTEAEFTEMARSKCAREITCLNCHDPHAGDGERWATSTDQDDANCLKCHEEKQSAEARAAHTRHPAGSEGDRCMNCHMPRLVQGMQGVLRTHLIFSPASADMLESNQPNACNLCHTKEPIDWTLKYLKEWYGQEYAETVLQSKYSDRDAPVALGWLKSDIYAVRLVAADALCRNGDRWAMPQLVNALNDPVRLNRRFARMGLERMLNTNLEKEYGYRYYMFPHERPESLKKIRDALLEPQEDGGNAAAPKP